LVSKLFFLRSKNFFVKASSYINDFFSNLQSRDNIKIFFSFSLAQKHKGREAAGTTINREI